MPPRKKTAQQLARLRIGLKGHEAYSALEMSALAKGTRPEAIAAQRRIQARIESSGLRAEMEKRAELTRAMDFAASIRRRTGKSFGGYSVDRSYADYDYWFSRALGRPLIKVLAGLAPKGKPLKMLEDGAGEGGFMSEAKGRLALDGIKSEATAIVAKKLPALAGMEAMGLVNRVLEGRAEKILPEGKFHAIFSVGGSMHHSRPELLKDLALKYCYALEKGGMAFIHLRVSAPERKPGKVFWSEQREIAKSKELVKNRLAKLGFEADFYRVEELDRASRLRKIVRKHKGTVLSDILIIRRAR